MKSNDLFRRKESLPLIITPDFSRKAETLEVCVAMLNGPQPIEQYLEKANIQSDCIIANQCDHYSFQSLSFRNHSVTVINTAERGVGLNRNNAWMRTSADIVLFADDDMVFLDGYPETALKAFRENPHADVIVFNIQEETPTVPQYSRPFYTRKTGFGAVRIAVRRQILRMHGIAFNLSFGGGCPFSHGEDTIFLSSCLRAGLKILVYPAFLARLTEERPSTWFSGFTDRYYFDKGVAVAAAGMKWPVLSLVLSDIRHRKFSPGKPYRNQIKCLRSGIRFYRNM